jgi:hypothetical protein
LKISLKNRQLRAENSQKKGHNCCNFVTFAY